jgi:hypothetical protein
MPDVMFVGGKADGHIITVPHGAITWSISGEKYIAIDYRTDKAQPMQRFFMPFGMAPADAVRRHLELCSAPKSTKS